MRLSRRRTQELLADWLGIELSVGCSQQTVLEAGRATAPLEAEMVAAIQAAELLHGDETGWKEAGRTVWLWVLTTATTTLYLIGSRSWDVIADIVAGFSGWLMSDGYGQYRRYGKRLRCLAHIIRKARGLADSTDPQAAQFGEPILETLALFLQGVYLARGDPERDLPASFAEELHHLRQWCQQHHDHPHSKVRALARELLNDWDTFWQVLHHPQLPLTNNAAERALRHWVIARKLSYGTRSGEGSRAYALLASVIDTCRQRAVCPWTYLARVIAERRKGAVPPPIPSPVS
jgi:hypothetical protein